MDEIKVPTFLGCHIEEMFMQIKFETEWNDFFEKYGMSVRFLDDGPHFYWRKIPGQEVLIPKEEIMILDTKFTFPKYFEGPQRLMESEKIWGIFDWHMPALMP